MIGLKLLIKGDIIKRYKIRKEHIKECLYLNETICDICKKKIQPDFFDREDISVEAHIGLRCEGDDDSIHYSFDICATCFLEELVPLIENKFKTKVEIDNEDRLGKREEITGPFRGF